MRPPLILHGMWGLGDNIYCRPFVRALAARHALYLETPWPELYSDLDVQFLAPPDRGLYTQMRNVRRQAPGRWSTPPARTPGRAISYGAEIEHHSIIATLERQVALAGAPLIMDLPALPAPPLTAVKPIALFRPVTVRREWRNEARNPRPEYLAELADYLRPTHTIVVVGSIAAGEEWLEGPPIKADVELLDGGLAILDLLALFTSAELVVGGVGWIVPAALAAKQFAFVVLGGHGKHNAPEKITDPRLDCSRLGFAMPQRFCQCSTMLHRCDKAIADLIPQFEAWRARAGLCSSASPASRSPGFPSSVSASTM